MRLRHLFGGIAVACSMALTASAPAMAGGGGHKHGASLMAAGGPTQSTTVVAGGGSFDRDVRGASVDPSAKSGHDHDNGLGNNCDPGLGGAVTKTGNFARFGANQTGDTACTHTRGVSDVSSKESTESTTSNTGTTISLNGVVIKVQEPREAIQSAVSAAEATRAASVSAAQAGIGLANTGSPLVPLSVATVILLVGGFLLRKLRPVA